MHIIVLKILFFTKQYSGSFHLGRAATKATKLLVKPQFLHWLPDSNRRCMMARKTDVSHSLTNKPYVMVVMVMFV